MRIGLIALSGLRAWDRELLDLGLSMPGFVERKEVIAQLPSLGLLTLAGLTPETDDISYHEIFDYATGELPEGDFDLVAISSFTAQIDDAYRIADRYRSRGATVVLGGLNVVPRKLRHTPIPLWWGRPKKFGRGWSRTLGMAC